MPHPLRIARPADPFLRFNVDEAAVVDYRIDGDHVGFIRPGRRGGELWCSALGDDPARVLALLDDLAAQNSIDGIHVHAAVYAHLPERLRIPEPGHWSMWTVRRGDEPDSLRDWAAAAADLAADDARIDPLLAHSDSAYLFAGSPEVLHWVGVSNRDDLLAVGGESTIADGTPHLVSICTAPGMRGRGLGRSVTARLVQGAFDRGCPEVYLEMYADNVAATRLYASLGFREVGRYRSGFLPGRGA